MSAAALQLLRPVTLTDQIELAYLADRYACWLHPKLVARVASANQQQPTFAKPELLPTIPDFIAANFLWPGSTCFYPGIRRKIGSEEKRSSYLAEGSLRTDSTGSAKAEQVWEKLAPTEIFRPKRSKSSTVVLAEAEDKPAVYRNGYHLVHLFPHKPSEVMRLLSRQELVTNESTRIQWEEALKTGFPGLFTSAANMCLLLGELTRPTDADSKLREVLWYRAVQLYGVDFLPPLLRPLGARLLANPPLPKLPEKVGYIGQEQPDAWWDKIDVARRRAFDTALRGWHKARQAKSVN